MKKTATAVFLALFLTAGAASRAAAAEIEIVKATGTIEIMTPGGVWKPAEEGNTVSRGWGVKCGRDGEAVLRWFTGNIIKMSPNTAVTIDSLSRDNATGAEISDFTLHSGRMFVMAKPLPTPESELKINTPSAIAGARGTQFMVSIAENKKTTLAVLDGQITVEAESIIIVLDTGYQIVVDYGQPPGEIITMPSVVRVEMEGEATVAAKVFEEIPPTVYAEVPAMPAPDLEDKSKTAVAAPSGGTTSEMITAGQLESTSRNATGTALADDVKTNKNEFGIATAAVSTAPGQQAAAPPPASATVETKLPEEKKTEAKPVPPAETTAETGAKKPETTAAAQTPAKPETVKPEERKTAATVAPPAEKAGGKKTTEAKKSEAKETKEKKPSTPSETGTGQVAHPEKPAEAPAAQPQPEQSINDAVDSNITDILNR